MHKKKTLFVRVDRIGDLVLTLPVDGIQELAPYSVKWCIASGLEFILEFGAAKREYFSIGKNFSFRNFLNFLSWLKKENFSSTVVFQAPLWVSFAIWLARIPVRVGRLSQWYSYLFYNKGLRQKRSLSQKHESEYNFELVDHLVEGKSKSRPTLALQNSDFERVLSRHGLTFKNYFVIHPGMGGSARNVSQIFYQKLVEGLAEHRQVVITGTAMDRAVTEPLRSLFKADDRIKFLTEVLSGPDIIAVLQGATSVIAPSTGVIHLAASTRTKSIGLYSPVLAQHANRWGPRGENVKVFMPMGVSCPGAKDCLFAACSQFDCMEQIKVESIIGEAIH